MNNFLLRSVSSVFLVLIILTSLFFRNILLVPFIVLLTIGFTIEWSVAWKKARGNPYLNCVGLMYICFSMYCFWMACATPILPYMIFLIVWITDSGAYLVGKMMGKTKLAPTISPNKTWEGFWGGSLLCALVCSLIYLKGDVTFLCFIKFFALSIVAHLGDLLQSATKRYLSIKDFGTLIPGHGGFLDRFDSFLAVAIVTALFF